MYRTTSHIAIGYHAVGLVCGDVQTLSWWVSKQGNSTFLKNGSVQKVIPDTDEHIQTVSCMGYSFLNINAIVATREDIAVQLYV